MAPKGPKIYNKLVRDRIPEIIEADGKKCVCETLPQDQYIDMLDAKLNEELAEYQESKSIDELADLLEVMGSVVKARGFSWEDLTAIQKKKYADRGGFDKRIFLKTVIDPTGSYALAERISRNKKEILAKITVPMLKKYIWLEENLHTCNVSSDPQYQSTFSGFYRMRFVTEEYRKGFFALFESIKENPNPSFEEVSRLLYAIDKRHEFSFISKMLHTINPSKPIFDSQVNAALKVRTFQPDFENKLKEDQKVLDRISEQYKVLMDLSAVKCILNEIDKRTHPGQISVEKKIDFVLWALGDKK